MKRPECCSECGVPVCDRRITPPPGVVRYGGKGRCDPCYEAMCRAEPVDADGRRDEWNATVLAAYIRARRARGWPDDGTLRGIV